MLLIRKNTLPAAAPRGLALGVSDRANVRTQRVHVSMSDVGGEEAVTAATVAAGSLSMMANDDVTLDQTPKQQGPSFTLQGVSIDEAFLEGELSAMRGMLEALRSTGSPSLPTT